MEPQNEALLKRVKQAHRLNDKQAEKLRSVFSHAPYMGQGNPAVARHPVSREQCLEKHEKEDVIYGNREFEKICGSPHMAPLYDPDNQKPEDAESCVDQFEFPGIPCEYPVIWVRARESAEICEAMGKRLCDAHEWEGACEGRLLEPDYPFELAKGRPPNAAVSAMAKAHNAKWGGKKTWAYGGDGYQKGVCAAASKKSEGCQGGSWAKCGSNTYPAGFFPQCRSPLGVYDLHGNAAEHMNLPLSEEQMSSRGSRTLGHTEMKGSWFIFDSYYAHQDWCRWRAPYWHGSRVMDKNSHHNYHLGFRCCKTVRKMDK
ncbi:SUMF1/EgtB/PvdO family nonheme iron enzyme [Fibrobacterota bacterium]